MNNKREIESNGYKTDHTLTINLSKYLNHTSSNVMFKAILKDNYIEMYKLFSKRTSLHFDSYFRRRVCENQFEFHRLVAAFLGQESGLYSATCWGAFIFPFAHILSICMINHAQQLLTLHSIWRTKSILQYLNGHTVPQSLTRNRPNCGCCPDEA